jgi:acetyl-CoA C-acetyltransferase
MQDIFITKAKRTAIGSFLGALSSTSPELLSAHLIRDIIADLDPNAIDEVILGHVLQGGMGQNSARQAAIKAGLPIETPSVTINKVCGSGLKSVALGWESILSGRNSLVLAGGHENMSLALHASYIRQGVKYGMNNQIDLIVRDGLSDAFSGKLMGITAENIAKKYNISRQAQDEFSYNSQMKAHMATTNGLFSTEISPIMVTKDKTAFSFEQDEFIKANSTIARLSQLKPAFEANGSVTAGNSSGINDGAAILLLASEQATIDHNLQPMAKIVSYSSVGVDPELMGIGPVPSIKKALKLASWKIEDVDLIELNEAFAAQSLAVIQELNLDITKVNVNGGAIALGHPIGASGARILVSLIHQMQQRNAKKAVASLCIGGGMGIAMCIER